MRQRTGFALVVLALMASGGSVYMAGASSIRDPQARQSAPAARQEVRTVFIRREGVDLRGGPGNSDPVLATLTLGESLTVLEETSTRLKVRTASGTEGFVSKINVSDRRPAGSSGGGSQLIVRGDTRRGEASGVQTVRGLSPLAEEYATKEQLPEEAVRQVKRMEAVGDGITAAEVEKFLREGGIVAP